MFLVVMLIFGIITSLHGMSPLATYGLGAIFFLVAAIVLFLIPAGLVAAELGTGWRRDGGVYIWVSEAFGSRAGFVATWLQWFQNVIFWTVILTSSEPARANSATWVAVAFASAVSVLVIDCTTTGWLPPTLILPTQTVEEVRRTAAWAFAVISVCGITF